MKRHASAEWKGDLVSGRGTLSGPSGVLKDTPYSYKARFEEPQTGINPEELLAAAHAGCFSMALSHGLAGAGHKPEQVNTKATVDFTKGDSGFSITHIHLDVTARVPGMKQNDFEIFANDAKKGCPVSRALAVEISMEARLES